MGFLGPLLESKHRKQHFPQGHRFRSLSVVFHGLILFCASVRTFHKRRPAAPKYCRCSLIKDAGFTISVIHHYFHISICSQSFSCLLISSVWTELFSNAFTSPTLQTALQVSVCFSARLHIPPLKFAPLMVGYACSPIWKRRGRILLQWTPHRRRHGSEKRGNRKYCYCEINQYYKTFCPDDANYLIM